MYQIEGKFAGLKEKVIKLRLNRIRLEQRVNEFGYDKVGWKERKKEREKASVKQEPQAALIEEWDNRYYLEVRIEGKKYLALYDTCATCSLIGPAVAKHFARRLLPNKSRIRTFNGATSPILGVLPVVLEIEGKRRQINFRAVNAMNQEMCAWANKAECA